MEDDGDDKDDFKRRTRNLSEKKRRDQFNTLVHELGAMISSNNRKMDKSTILRTTIYFLKNHNEITARARAHDVQDDWKPAFLTNEEFTYLLLEALEGFVIVFSANGRIIYVSESVASLLGHNPNDIINKNIYDLVYKDDRCNLYGLLQNPDTSVHAAKNDNADNEINFQCLMRRGTLDFRDDVSYELIQFNGYFRTDIEQDENCDLTFEDPHDSRVVYFCTAKLGTPQLIRDVSLVDPDRNEFVSRHSLEWKFLFLDHRAPPIIGYLPFEVLGTSGYDYYHFDDLEKVITCHEALMQKGELTSCYYRFLTKGQQWIWLQSRFYITYHQWHSKPEFVVCTHRVVSYVDVQTPTKQENIEQDTSTDCEPSHSGLKEPLSEEATAVSPSYMSESSDAYGNCISQIQQQSQSVKSMPTSADSVCATVASAGTPVTPAASWPSRSPYQPHGVGSDTGSVSGDSRSSQRNSSQDTQNVHEATLVPQHNIGAQYLEPVPYVGPVSMPGVLPMSLPPLPVIVSPNQAQLQLQRTHRELQHMIFRQQEELRLVKEQLMLARLGIFQPMISVQDPYGHNEEILHVPRIPPQIVYDGTHPRALGGYTPHQLHQPQPLQLPQAQALQAQALQAQAHQAQAQQHQSAVHESQMLRSPVHQPNTSQSPVQQSQMKLSPVEQSQMQLSPVQQSQMKLSPVQQSQMKLSPVQQSQMKLSPVQQSQMKLSPVQQSQMKLSPVQQSQMKLSPVEQSQMQLSPVEQSQMQLSPVQQSQMKLSPVQQSQMKLSPVEQSQMQLSPVQQSQMQLSPVQQSQMKLSPVQQSQMQLSPVQQSQMKLSPVQQSQMQLSPVQQSQTQLSPVQQSQTPQVQTFQVQLHPEQSHPLPLHQSQAPQAQTLQVQAPQLKAHHSSVPKAQVPQAQALQIQGHHVPTHRTPVQQAQAIQVQAHQVQALQAQAHQVQSLQAQANQVQALQAQAHHSQGRQVQTLQAQAHHSSGRQVQTLQAQAHHSSGRQAQAPQVQTLQAPSHQAHLLQAQGHQAQMQQSQTRQSQAHQSQMQQSQTRQSQAHQSQMQQSQTRQSQAHQSQMQQSQTRQSQAHQSQMQQSQTRQSQAHQSQMQQSQTRQSQAHQSQMQQSQTRQSQAHQSQMQQSQTRQSQAHQSQMQQSQTRQSQAHQSQMQQSQTRQSQAHQSQMQQSQTRQSQALQSQMQQSQTRQSQAHQSQMHQVHAHPLQPQSDHPARGAQNQYNPNMSRAPQ
ncbi:circadian locomoter output cycles protein kaput isoform X3 [Bicyclus anynana]|uniref:Circadian locomoter output cycles protein kaput isoform X3 n=1 Tax=Bicyclus anynana TaxID=110368 RepID=A0ABM3M4S1_BICAN|nr:circadian locomoter output cycles protein kaput isoform X3 [Bicyclus anynana]